MQHLNLKTVNKRIKYLFLESRMTQAEFAAAVGRKQSYMSLILAGRQPSLKLIRDIARVTGTSALWIESGDGEMHSGDNNPLKKFPELGDIVTELVNLWPHLDKSMRYENAGLFLRQIDELKMSSVNSDK